MSPSNQRRLGVQEGGTSKRQDQGIQSGSTGLYEKMYGFFEH